ncbi:hypothetical protein L2E82_36092 [Cichorium intybus]|uniref:Uncharacterized protein n=1 Tax=Cichorium intybus TaxID=13427 RepID=A0ACB9BQN6_CICIN|nr:hypothetical protein L2E82_36092 [Cichorium intybus]
MQVLQPYNAEAPPLYQPQFQYDVGPGQDLPVNYPSGLDFQGNPTAGSEPLFASLGLCDDGVAVPPPQPTENSAVKKGRGRPPKVKRGRGRPRRIGVGRGTAVIVTGPRQLVVYQELKTKYDLLELANVVKPCIDPNYGTVALQALQELEALAGAETTNGPSHGQVQEPEPVSVSVPVSGPYSQN